MKLNHITSIFGAAIVALLASCGGHTVSPEATALYDQANQAYETADYARSILLLDSLQKAFPAEIDLQRQGMALRPKVIEKATILQISTNDSLMANAKVEAQNLMNKLKWVKTPRMLEGYWTGSAAYNPDFMNSTGIQARVSEIGEFYIVSSMKPSSLNHTSVTIACGSAQASTPEVPYDGESNYRIGGGEIITFSPAQSDTIGYFALENRDKQLSLTFRGKTAKTVKLTARQVEAIADAYTYARAIQQGRQLAVERQRLEAVLQTARNQMARTADLPEDDNAPAASSTSAPSAASAASSTPSSLGTPAAPEK